MLARHFLSPFFPELVFRVNTSEKILYLTFDDGPTQTTPWVLDELKKYNALATFFCVGNNVEKNPLMYSEIIKQGHSIGNHTMHHLNGWKTKTKNYISDVEQCDVVLKSFSPAASSQKPEAPLFRPPHGRITPIQYSSLKKNHRIVMWDVLSKDYDENISAEKCLKRVIAKSKSGSVIVFHDSVKAEKNLRYVLPKVLEYFSKKNFSFCSLHN